MTDDRSHGNTGNHVLDGMAPELRRQIDAQLTMVDLGAGAVLVEAGDAKGELWFPFETAMLAMSVRTDDGRQTDVAFVGRESVVASFGPNNGRSYTTISVLFPGRFAALRLDGSEDSRFPELNRQLALHSEFFIIQMLQSVACRASHTVEQRIARLLSQQLRRHGSQAFDMTQAQIARMLGVGRTFVNQAIGRLRTSGVVGFRRGSITIQDADRVEAMACDCSRQLDRYFDKLAGQTAANALAWSAK